MNIDRLKEIICKGEGIGTEFKESKTKLNKDVYETICAFLNRNGGHLILGITDNKTICGVNKNVS